MCSSLLFRFLLVLLLEHAHGGLLHTLHKGQKLLLHRTPRSATSYREHSSEINIVEMPHKCLFTEFREERIFEEEDH